MNRKLLIILVTIAVLIIASVAGYALTRPQTSASTGSPSTPNSSESNSSGSGSSGTADSSRYVDYSPSAIADASGTRLLFFHATWCPSCRQIESEIIEQGVPEGVTIIKVDYDSNQDLRQKYGVTVQTTFVSVDASGEEIASFVPYGGDLSLNSVLDKLT
jgi:thiol-disulfide isomerase/thioredoxin